jgi:Berberine and berberine like
MFAVGMLPAPELQAPVRSQVRAVKHALAPWAAKHMYLNFAETQQDTTTFWTEQAHHRLRRIKTAIDPDNVIRSNHAIPPVPPRARSPT